MTNEDYRKLRTEMQNHYQLLYTYAKIEKGMAQEVFDDYFPLWCLNASGGLPIQICINMILNYLDDKHNYIN